MQQTDAGAPDRQVYGPKGVGGLYVRRRPRVRLEAQINGGRQERGLRSGTLPTPLVVGFGAACELAGEEMEADHAWVTHLSEVRPAPSRLLPSSCQGLSGDLRVCVMRSGCTMASRRSWRR